MGQTANRKMGACLNMTIRDILEEKAVSDVVDAFERDCPQMSEAWRGLGWLLVRTPEIGFVIDDKRPGLRIHRMNTLGNLPDICVMYTFDESIVNICAIRVIRKD